ncbi:MAG: fimbrillin family protein [Prevotella sp.]|nr:fimbrillin family protein [Prevotella sp.]
MKKYIYIAFAALGLAACGSDEITEPVMTLDGKQTPMTLTTVVGEPTAVSRAAGTDAQMQKAQIVQGQKVGVFITDALDRFNNATTQAYATRYFQSGLEFVANGSGGWQGTIPALYWPVDGNNVIVRAYAPKQSAWSINGTNTFKVQSNQTSTANYLASDLLNGLSTTADATTGVTPRNEDSDGTAATIPIKFTHKMAKITIKFANAGAGFNNSTINGVYIVNTIAAATVTTDKYGGITNLTTSGTTTADIQSGTSSAESSAIVVPTQKVGGTKNFLKVTTSDGGVFYYKPTEFTLEGGKEYVYTLQLSLYGLTVTSSSIEEWTTVNQTTTVPTLNFS